MKKRLLSGLAAICMLPLIAPVSAEPTATDIPAGAQTAPETDRIYCIASVSKMYTATAIIQLADEGKLSLEDSITNYLPDFKMEDERY
ncbi:MAG: serine hydrolase, partial [Oscillospiraceae bacterium]|nr:serine hydrolase [Oscillospiraceae bacterium]